MEHMQILIINAKDVLVFVPLVKLLILIARNFSKDLINCIVLVQKILIYSLILQLKMNV